MAFSAKRPIGESDVTPTKRARLVTEAASTPTNKVPYGRKDVAVQSYETKEFLKRIRDDYSSAFAKLKGIKTSAGCKETAPGKTPVVEMQCWLCQRSKHSCSWEYKNTGSETIATGGSCYSCVKASQLLNIARSRKVLSQVKLEEAVLAVSQRVQAERGEADKCRCSMCKQKSAEF